MNVSMKILLVCVTLWRKGKKEENKKKIKQETEEIIKPVSSYL